MPQCERASRICIRPAHRPHNQTNGLVTAPRLHILELLHALASFPTIKLTAPARRNRANPWPTVVNICKAHKPFPDLLRGRRSVPQAQTRSPWQTKTPASPYIYHPHLLLTSRRRRYRCYPRIRLGRSKCRRPRGIPSRCSPRSRVPQLLGPGPEPQPCRHHRRPRHHRYLDGDKGASPRTERRAGQTASRQPHPSPGRHGSAGAATVCRPAPKTGSHQARIRG